MGKCERHGYRGGVDGCCACLASEYGRVLKRMAEAVDLCESAVGHLDAVRGGGGGGGGARLSDALECVEFACRNASKVALPAGVTVCGRDDGEDI